MNKNQTYAYMFVMILVIFFMLFRKNTIYEGMTSNSNNIKYGMWCMNQNCLQSNNVPSGLTRIYVGAFESQNDGIPKKAGGTSNHMTGADLATIKKISGATDIYVTVGGALGAKEATAEDLVNFYQKDGFEFDGLDFDNEGALIHSDFYSFVKDTVSTVSKRIGKPLKIQYTILAGDNTYDKYLADYQKTRAEFENSKDVVSDMKISLMLYGSHMDDSGWGIKDCTPTSDDHTLKIIDTWINSGIPLNQIILGMTTALQNNKCYLKHFTDIVTKNNLGGINFWQAGTVCKPLIDGNIPQLKCNSSHGKDSYRCGSSWSDANLNCNDSCQTRDDCDKSKGYIDCYAPPFKEKCEKQNNLIQHYHTIPSDLVHNVSVMPFEMVLNINRYSEYQ